ncbi:Uncharacterised protein [Citrobacter freundii]|nr:Uncharacterised protein [Citrobacter freundii]
MPQPHQDPALHDQNGIFNLGLVFGFTWSGRYHRRVVVAGQLTVVLVQDRLIAVCTADRRFQVIRDQKLRHSAEELERPDVGHQPAFLALVFAGFDVGVV